MKSKNLRYSKKRLALYITLRIFVIAVLIEQLIKGNYNNVFMCVLTLILFMIPTIVDRTLNVKLPTALEVVILLFIFSAEILGEIHEYYIAFPHWDTMLHTINGFLMAAIGFAMIDILNQHPKFHINMSPIFVAFVAFCFSMTIGVLWEFFEFSMDCFFKTDMQKDAIYSTVSSITLNPAGTNVASVISDIQKTVITGVQNGVITDTTIPNGYLDIGLYDTMKDLIVNCVGAVIFSIIGYFYIIGRGKGLVAKSFIPQMKTKEEIAADKAQDEALKAEWDAAIENRKKKGKIKN